MRNGYWSLSNARLLEFRTTFYGEIRRVKLSFKLPTKSNEDFLLHYDFFLHARPDMFLSDIALREDRTNSEIIVLFSTPRSPYNFAISDPRQTVIADSDRCRMRCIISERKFLSGFPCIFFPTPSRNELTVPT